VRFQPDRAEFVEDVLQFRQIVVGAGNFELATFREMRIDALLGANAADLINRAIHLK